MKKQVTKTMVKNLSASMLEPKLELASEEFTRELILDHLNVVYEGRKITVLEEAIIEPGDISEEGEEPKFLHFRTMIMRVEIEDEEEDNVINIR